MGHKGHLVKARKEGTKMLSENCDVEKFYNINYSKKKKRLLIYGDLINCSNTRKVIRNLDLLVNDIVKYMTRNQITNERLSLHIERYRSWKNYYYLSGESIPLPDKLNKECYWIVVEGRKYLGAA